MLISDGSHQRFLAFCLYIILRWRLIAKGQDPAKNILLCTRTHVISTVTKKSTLGKKAVSETTLFPKKTALEKRAVSETPLFPQ
jgi:hypothetical protein